MKVFNVINAGAFMTKLLTKEDFDDFALEEGKIVTGNTFVIDGRKQKAFFEEADEEYSDEIVFRSWKNIRPVCYEIIKGKKVPLSVVLTLHAPQAILEQLQQEALEGMNLRGLMLQVRYENGNVSMVTGCNLSGFSLDKSADMLWDKKAEQLLSEKGIVL